MLYQQHYRIETNRLPHWDYQSAGYYFITICANNRHTYPFGYVRNGYVCLSNIGAMAYRFWSDIPRHFANMSLDTFVIMPDHVHGIIILYDFIKTNPVETLHATSLRYDVNNRYEYYSSISPKIQSVPTIIRSYKSAVTQWCNQNHHPFQWQPRYYDRIIRTELELYNVRRYILNNPKNLKKTDS